MTGYIVKVLKYYKQAPNLTTGVGVRMETLD